jgi:hypothetical protein
MIFGFLLIAAGYAGVYYAVDVLVWAHFSTSTNDPVSMAACLGFPGGRSQPFMPPVTLGILIPGAITDARGLLGGTPTTGAYLQAAAPGPPGGGMGGMPLTKGGVPLNPGAGGGGGAPGASSPSFNIGSLENPATRPRPPGFIGPVAVNPVSRGATTNGFGTPAAPGRPATGVYNQGLVQQNANGTWSLSPEGVRASHGG